jgi:hypothetical protein
MDHSLSSSLTTERAVFVVRLWWETGGEVGKEHPGEWRGSVELLGSGQPHYFRNLQDVVDIMSGQLKPIPIQQEEPNES